MKKENAAIRLVLWTCVVTVAVVLARTLWVALYVVPQDCMQPFLLAGDRVLVNRWSYGLRLPFSIWGGYCRQGTRRPAKGDWVVFNLPIAGSRPDTSMLCVGRVAGCPGDTVWMGPSGRVSTLHSYVSGCIWPLAVPAARSYVQIHPWNTDIYHHTIRQHEADTVTNLEFRPQTDGDTLPYYHFGHNYYWMESGNDTAFFDSRTFGFVPEECLVGGIVRIIYSLDPAQPLHRAWRNDRFFHSPYDE